MSRCLTSPEYATKSGAHAGNWSGEYRTVSFRCLVGAWLALSLVAANAYSCLLHSVMSVPAFGARVSTIEELEAALQAGKMTAGTANGTAQARAILVSHCVCLFARSFGSYTL